VVAVVACSTPSPRIDKPVASTSGDAATTDAAAAVTVDGRPTDDDAPYRPRFDWQQLRDDYTRYRKGERWFVDGCKFHAAPQTLGCMGPIEVAGQVLRAVDASEGRVAIIIDRGAADMITPEWTVAVLDDEGHPLTPWTSIGHMRGDHECYAEVEASGFAKVRDRHVGMRIDQRVLEHRLQRIEHKGPFH
jgi:hypothetical protein